MPDDKKGQGSEVSLSLVHDSLNKFAGKKEVLRRKNVEGTRREITLVKIKTGLEKKGGPRFSINRKKEGNWGGEA